MDFFVIQRSSVYIDLTFKITYAVIVLLSLFALLTSVLIVHIYSKLQSQRRTIALLRDHCFEQEKKIKQVEFAKKTWQQHYVRLLLFYGHALQDIPRNIHVDYADYSQDSRLFGWLRGMATMGDFLRGLHCTISRGHQLENEWFTKPLTPRSVAMDMDGGRHEDLWNKIAGLSTDQFLWLTSCYVSNRTSYDQLDAEVSRLVQQ